MLCEFLGSIFFLIHLILLVCGFSCGGGEYPYDGDEAGSAHHATATAGHPATEVQFSIKPCLFPTMVSW